MAFLPFDLVPDWLVETPITFEDLRCTRPPSTIYRISLPSSPVQSKEHHFDSLDSTAMPPQPLDLIIPTEQKREEGRDARSFLWVEIASSPGSFSNSDDDDNNDDNDDMFNERENDPSPIDPFFSHTAPAHPRPSSPSSFDCASPWFMHFDVDALAALDNQLLQSPFDAFADLCYAHAVNLADQDAGATTGAYSWRRFSQLRPLSPFSDDEDEDSESESDPDSDHLASPEHAPVLVVPRVYSPTPGAGAHPSRHYHEDSDGSIQQVASSTSQYSHIAKPLPQLPPPSPRPSTSTHRSHPSLPSHPSSPSFPLHSPDRPAAHSLDLLRSASPEDAGEQEARRSGTASPSPLSPLSPSAVASQAQLVMLFKAPRDPSESVHFFPGDAAGNAKSGGRRGGSSGGLRSPTPAGSSGGRWYRRVRAGLAPGHVG